MMKARFFMLLVVTGIFVLGCVGKRLDLARDYDQAIHDYNKVIEVNPRYAEAYNNRGIAYFYKGDYDQAIRDSTKAIEIGPRYAGAYYNRGAAYAKKGENDQAIRDLKKACELGLEAACRLLRGLQPQ